MVKNIYHIIKVEWIPLLMMCNSCWMQRVWEHKVIKKAYLLFSRFPEQQFFSFAGSSAKVLTVSLYLINVPHQKLVGTLILLPES